MIFNIISSTTEKAMDFANEILGYYHEFAQTLPDFTPDNNKYWIRSTGETSMRKICVLVSASIVQSDSKIQFVLDTKNQMGSLTDCLISAEQFIIKFKKYLQKNLKKYPEIPLKCAKYSKDDDTLYCGNPTINLNIYIDEEIPMCLCDDARHIRI